MDPKLAKVSFAEYSAQWMANGGTRGRLAPRIREYYGDLLRLHILPSFDREAIGAIRNDDVRAWLAALSVDRPLQAAKAYRLLSTILATAVTDRRITVAPTFVGLKNYLYIFTEDPNFWQALKVTFTYVALTLPLSLVIGLALSLLLNQKVPGSRTFSTLF